METYKSLETSEKIKWIKDLVRSEQQLEESGLVDYSPGFDGDSSLAEESLRFIAKLKSDFVDTANTFNELKPSALGRIKVYGIAQTQADFMLFRNGFKMIFSLKSPGVISIRFNFIGTSQLPTPNVLPGAQSASSLMEEHLIEAKWGAFGEIIWTYKNVPIKNEYVVKYHLSLFIKESIK